MATSRPFAYNPGSILSGTEQYGTIAVGTGNNPYSENYGGLQWWEGPDEDLGYCIGTSVPSGDHPTPLGNIGTVQFWRTNAFDDNQFISLSNILSNQNFSSSIEAITWLNDNGYWTSYVGSSGYTSVCFVLDVPSVSENAFDIEYSPTSQEIYLNNFFGGTGAYVIDSNTLQYKGTLPVTGTSGNGQFAIDLSSNKLFTGSVNLNYIVKYDLSGLPVSGRTIDAAAQPYGVTNNFFQIAYNPVDDKLYVANDDFRKLYILTGSNLSTIAEIDMPALVNGFNNVGVNTNNGNVITTFKAVLIGGQLYNYFIIDGDTNEITYSGFTGNGAQMNNLTKVMFSPVNNKFYLIQFLGGTSIQKVIQVIDATTGLFIKTINLSNSNSNNQQSAIIYDSLRNYIWTPDRLLKQWVVIDCNTDEIVLTFEETLGCGGSYYGGLFATYDTLNDRMVVTAGSSYSKKYFELSEIIPG